MDLLESGDRREGFSQGRIWKVEAIANLASLLIRLWRSDSFERTMRSIAHSLFNLKFSFYNVIGILRRFRG
jgi:hypothetical protein